MDVFVLPCESACSVQDSQRGGERCSGWVKAKNLLLDALCAAFREPSDLPGHKIPPCWWLPMGHYPPAALLIAVCSPADLHLA